MGTIPPSHGAKSPKEVPPKNDFPKRPEPPSTTKATDIPSSDTSSKPSRAIAPPPKMNGIGDFYNEKHRSLSMEYNPFEQSFGGGPGPQSPGTKLPSVAALASPSSMMPGNGTPFHWPGSLRSGPLSPAMLSGPQNDYFSDTHGHYKGGFPTPNESSMRTGLTPVNGSMFPSATPVPTSLFASLHAASAGAATPSTLDFQRTAIAAAAKREHSAAPPAPLLPPSTSLAADPSMTATAASHYTTSMPPPADSKQAYDHHDNDAANGLYMLAQSRSPMAHAFGNTTLPMAPTSAPVETAFVPGSVASAHSRSASHPNQHHAPPPQHQQQHNAQQLSISTTATGGPSEHSIISPNQEGNGSAVSVGTTTSEEAGPSSSRRNSRKSPVIGGRIRKAPVGGGSRGKRVKAQTPSPQPTDDDDDDDVKMADRMPDQMDKSKMTEDEKRKNFLERNRVAALKCRQRKKQWLQSLQNKVEELTTENESYLIENSRLRSEVLHLRSVLMKQGKELSPQDGSAVVSNGAFLPTAPSPVVGAGPPAMITGPAMGPDQSMDFYAVPNTLDAGGTMIDTQRRFS